MKIRKSNYNKRNWFVFFDNYWSWHGKWSFFKHNTFNIHKVVLTDLKRHKRIYYEIVLFGNVFYLILKWDF